MNGSDGADEEEPGGGAGEGHGGDDDKGPVEMTSALQDKAGDRWSDNAGEIADEILEAGPAAGSDGAGERLSDGPKVGGGDTKENDAEDEGSGAVDRVTEASETDKDAAEGEAAPGEGLADEGESGAGRDPTIGEPAGEK